ncbi:hypothetical protein [Streptomyces sp. NPDC051554]|uniref:hypothetical protein n=1 Tax=Streptomyces sp. NPDC051554 TaxID=3365656 RepID=UPI0037A3481F
MSAPAVTAVQEAVEQVRDHFAEAVVTAVPDGGGGVYVVVDPVPVGDHYTVQETWLGFQITAAYPDADIYPHYTGLLARADGQPHGQPVQQIAEWQGRLGGPVLQISRRSNQWNPAVDSAVNKSVRILAWLADQ